MRARHAVGGPAGSGSSRRHGLSAPAARSSPPGCPTRAPDTRCAARSAPASARAARRPRTGSPPTPSAPRPAPAPRPAGNPRRAPAEPCAAASPAPSSSRRPSAWSPSSGLVNSMRTTPWPSPSTAPTLTLVWGLYPKKLLSPLNLTVLRHLAPGVHLSDLTQVAAGHDVGGVPEHLLHGSHVCTRTEGVLSEAVTEEVPV